MGENEGFYFKHRVDKNAIPTCTILGVKIAAINMEWLINYINSHIKEMAGDYICVSNVHTTITAYEDSAYRKIQNGGIMAIPDGGPLSTVGRKMGYKSMQRTTGPGLMEEIFKISVKNGYRHFFYGSTEETLKKLQRTLLNVYPGIQIVGMFSPPFRPLNEAEDADIIEKINQANPDFIWIGLGAPKQEQWMARHQGRVKGLMLGVGAGFDYFAGNIERAPEWMQRNNLEWLFRLIQDPKRLFGRYWHTNTKFIWYTLIRGKKGAHMGIIKRLKLLRCKLLLSRYKNITIGENSTFGRGTIFWAPNRLIIGNNVYIGKYCTLQADIELGNNIEIANNVGLIGKYDHDYSKVGVNIKDAPWIGDKGYNFKGKDKKIIIEDDVWIGYGAIIFTGITIHRGAMIAAGSVVTHDVPAYTIVAGNPARAIGKRFTDEQISEHERYLYG